MQKLLKKYYAYGVISGIIAILGLLLLTRHWSALASTPTPAHSLSGLTQYRLKSPLPSIVNAGTVSEGVSTSGYRTMWKDGSNVVHIFAPFGGNNDVDGWKAQYINTNTGVHALVAGPPHGAAMAVNYNPNNDRLYIAASNGNNGQSCLSEFSAATHLATTLKTGLNNVIGGLQMGDDKRVYFPAQGPALYSYDPALGMPNGWKDYGTITNLVDYGINYISLGVDASHVYMGMPKKGDGTWSLWVTPISGTPKWTEWQYGNAGDTAVGISREADTGKLYLRRRLSDNSTIVAYYLANGTFTSVSPIPHENYDDKKAPRYCSSFQDSAMYHVFSDTYGWDFDDTDLFPIKGIHEFTQARYRRKGSQTWIAPQDSYTGPWVPQVVRCVLPKTENNLFLVSGGYGADLNFNYVTKAKNYLGASFFSPYTIMKHSSGEIYLGGYPNSVMRYDPTHPWTLTSIKTKPRLPSDTGKPNPYFIKMTPGDQLHYRHGLDYDCNGVVWIGGNTTRKTPDYGNVMWYKPSDGTVGYIFSGWRSAGTKFANLCAASSRARICVSDNSGNIWVINASTKKVDTAPIVPVLGGSKTYMIEVENDIVFGIVISSSGNKVIKFRPATKEVLTLKDLAVPGSPFGFGDNQYDRMNFKLEMGPDGYIWMFVGDSLYRVDPITCLFTKLLDTPHAKLKFAPNNLDLLLYNIDGTTDFKYIPGILEVASP